MRLILLTQDEPFFLPGNLERFLKNLPSKHKVVACVLMGPSPFGKRINLSQKLKESFQIFGASFLLHYGLRFIKARLSKAPTVASTLKAHGIPIIQPTGSINTPAFIETLRAYHPDLLISVAANQIFKRPLIDLAPKGCINLHTSLLPKYRGLMPSFWVLRFGEPETGVSVFFVDEGIDSGPILVQTRVPTGSMTQQALIEHTKRLGMDAILQAIKLIDQGNPNLLPNPNDQMTYFRFPTAEDVRAFRAQGARFF